MKLKPIKRKVETPVKTKEVENSAPKKKLAADEYKPMFPPTRFLVREEPSKKDPTKVVKQYIEISVKRYNDDSAMPYVWCTMYQESDFYTGYLKGKSIYLPLAMLYDFIDHLTDVSEECDKRNIVD